MSVSEQFSVLIGAAGLVLNVVLFVAVLLQLKAVREQVWHGRQATDLDHARRKKQSTIEYYAMTLESRLSIPEDLPFDRDDRAVRSYLKRIGQGDSDRVRAVHNYLSLFELLATGVNTDVFDAEVVRRMAGGRVRSMARNYGPWIDARRAAQNAPLLFDELLTLAKKFEQQSEPDRATDQS